MSYHAFKDLEWQDNAPIGGRTRALRVKVLPTSHFFYRKVIIERPLRVRVEVTTGEGRRLRPGYEL